MNEIMESLEAINNFRERGQLRSARMETEKLLHRFPDRAVILYCDYGDFMLNTVGNGQIARQKYLNFIENESRIKTKNNADILEYFELRAYLMLSHLSLSYDEFYQWSERLLNIKPDDEVIKSNLEISRKKENDQSPWVETLLQAATFAFDPDRDGLTGGKPASAQGWFQLILANRRALRISREMHQSIMRKLHIAASVNLGHYLQPNQSGGRIHPAEFEMIRDSIRPYYTEYVKDNSDDWAVADGSYKQWIFTSDVLPKEEDFEKAFEKEKGGVLRDLTLEEYARHGLDEHNEECISVVNSHGDIISKLPLTDATRPLLFLLAPPEFLTKPGQVIQLSGFDILSIVDSSKDKGAGDQHDPILENRLGKAPSAKEEGIPTTTSRMGSYINKFYKIAIDYPSGWTVKFIDGYPFLTVYFTRYPAGKAPFLKLVATPIVATRNTLENIQDHAHGFIRSNNLTLLQEYRTLIGRNKIDSYVMEYVEKQANNLLTKQISFLKQGEEGIEYQILCSHRDTDVDGEFSPNIFKDAIDSIRYADIPIQTTCSCGSEMTPLGKERYRCERCEKVVDFKNYIAGGACGCSAALPILSIFFGLGALYQGWVNYQAGGDLHTKGLLGLGLGFVMVLGGALFLYRHRK